MHLSRIRPRLTVRRLMIVVAIVGLLMGAGRWVVEMRTRSAAYLERAYKFADSGGYNGHIDSFVTTEDGAFISFHQDENYWLRYAWGRKLANKYWRLANRPWLPVEPDPPLPERLARPRAAVDCPAELRSRVQPCPWYLEPVYPWWTYPWTCRNQYGAVVPRWSFP